jgi:putative spermidine/putrescine transport system permease protein
MASRREATFRRNSSTPAPDVAALIHRGKQGRYAFLPGLAPILLLYAVFLVAPMLLLGRYSFYEMAPGSVRVRSEWSLDSFGRFFSDPFYLRILGETLLVGLLVVLISIVLSYPLAYVLARVRTGKGILYLMVLAPFFVSQVVKTYAWMVILSNQGFLNWILISTGVTDEPVQMLYNRVGVIIGMVHVLMPFLVLTLESVIRQINDEVLDAARSLGAPEHQVILRVVLPLSVPGLVAGSLLVFSLAISIFTTPALMGGDRIQLMSNFIYKRAISLLDWPLASVAAWVLLIAGTLVVVAYLKAMAPRRGREA